MRIASYNVRYFSHSLRGLASTRRSLEAIAAQLAPLDLDVLCLQEVRTQAQLDRFAQALHWRGRALHFPAHVGALYSTGLAILVDGAALVAQSAQPLTLDGERGERRICAHVELRGPLHVFNTHLSLPPFGRGFGHGENQLRQAERLSDWVRERARGEPFILCGDFNSRPSSPVERHFGGLAPQTPTAGIGPLRLRLDYLFGGNGVTWLDDEGSHAFGDRGGRFHGLSDHVPLISRFSIGSGG